MSFKQPTFTPSKIFEWDEFVNVGLRKNVDMETEIILDKNSNNYALFVENRNIEYADVIIRNTLLRLGPEWGLIMYIDSKCDEYYKKQLELVHNITWIIRDLTDFNADRYSDLLMTSQFWNCLPGEKILVFQADTWIFKDNINDFMKFDYIGSPWCWCKPIGKVGGNGGLSLRTKQAMINLCIKKEMGEFDDYKVDKRVEIEKEDVFFSTHMIKDENYCMPEFNEALYFSSETVYCYDPFGLHQMYLKFDYEKIMFLFRNYGKELSYPLKTIKYEYSTKSMSKNKIPRTIWQTCYTDQYDYYARNTKYSVLQHNRKYNYVFHDSNDRDAFIKEYGSEKLNKYYDLISWEHIKIWIWKILVLYYFGGVYIDPRMKCLQNLDNLINEEDEFITYIDSTEHNYKVIIVAPRHMLISNLLGNLLMHLDDKNMSFSSEIYYENRLINHFVNHFKEYVETNKVNNETIGFRDINNDEFSQYFEFDENVENELKIKERTDIDIDQLPFLKDPYDATFRWKPYKRLSDVTSSDFIFANTKYNIRGISKLPIIIQNGDKTTTGHVLSIIRQKNNLTYSIGSYGSKIIESGVFDILECNTAIFDFNRYAWQRFEYPDIPERAMPLTHDPYMNEMYLCRYIYEDTDKKLYDLGYCTKKHHPTIYAEDSSLHPKICDILIRREFVKFL